MVRQFMTKQQVLQAAACGGKPLSYVTIWQWMRTGKFPLGVMVGRETRWYADEVEAWQNARPRQVLLGDPDAPKLRRGRKRKQRNDEVSYPAR